MDFLRLRSPLAADVDLASTTPPSSSSCNTSLSSWPYYPSPSKPLATGGGGRTNHSSTRGFDINLPPSNEDDVDDEAEEGDAELAGGRGSSLSPSPARSSVVVPSPPKRKREEEEGYHELALLKTQEESSSPASDDEDGPTRKKLRLTKEQSALLEESFSEHSTLNPKQKSALAKQLNLKPRQVEVWFQNRRARTKLKQTEVDCELLRRCYESLTEENRRLQKEVQELRALKVAPPRYLSRDYYMSMPATTLSMCPSCEKIAPLDSLTTNNSSNANSSNKKSSNTIPTGSTAFLTNSTNNVFNGGPIAMPRHQFFQQAPSSSPQLYHQLNHHHHNINLQHSHH